MQLPKYIKKNRFKFKICQEPGCGAEYFGHVISKYCKIHSDVKNRKRKRKGPTDPSILNMVFEHHFEEVTLLEFPCAVPGCKNTFKLYVYPKQKIYPKYCEEHRITFKRETFVRRRRRNESTNRAGESNNKGTGG